jgi:hypothetical protein
MKISLTHFLCIIAILLTSCGTPPAASISGANSEPSEIKDPQIGAPYTEISIQEIRTFNCDGANPTTTVSRSLIQEQTTFFQVDVEAGGLIRGTPIPGVLEAELESKIKAALGDSVGNTSTQAINTTLETPPGQALHHKISWKETKVKGVIDVVYQDGTAKLDFEKVIGIELFGRTSEPLSCSGQEATQPVQSGSIAVLPSPTPYNSPTAAPIQPSSSVEFVRREATGGYATKKYDISLGDGEIIAGQGYGFQQQTGGCVAYIIKGPGQFTFSVTDGAWLYYKNVTSVEQIELLLQNQIDSLVQYEPCTPATVKILRLP